MHLSELKALHVSALLEMAIGLDIDNAARLRGVVVSVVPADTRAVTRSRMPHQTQTAAVADGASQDRRTRDCTGSSHDASCQRRMPR